MAAMQSLEEKLLKHKLVSPEDLAHAKREIGKSGKQGPPLHTYLLNIGAITEDAFLRMQAQELGIEYKQLDDVSPEPAVVTIIPEEIAVDKGLIAIEKADGQLLVATQNPDDWESLEHIQRQTGLTVKPVIASRGAILRKLSEYHDHYRIGIVEKLMSSIKDQGLELGKSLGIDIGDIKQLKEQAPIIQMINLFLLGALTKRASDIHLVPNRKHLNVYYRIDGVLQQSEKLAIASHPAIVSRIKIMCNLDIAERRKPQDGAFHIMVQGREIDFRVAISPTVCGEKVVLRVLDKGAMMLGLDHLGLEGQALQSFKRLIHKPNGILLIVGPTGSGKTTTLYSALNALNTGDKNITTVEDPVEYEIEGLTQIQVQPEIELDFAAALRSILRQDPDIILIGEVRDLETTEIAIRASLTGHLVFATLHTNDAAGAVARLTEMGAEPYLIASTVRASMSQRLVRTICPKCKEACPTPPGAIELVRSKYGAPLPNEIQFFRGKGCRHCFFTGFRGRAAVAEILIVTEEIRRAMVTRAPSSEIQALAMKQGMRTMFQNGIDKVLRGVTTLEEVLEIKDDED